MIRSLGLVVGLWPSCFSPYNVRDARGRPVSPLSLVLQMFSNAVHGVCVAVFVQSGHLSS
jgi:hypothetical protein